MASGVLLVSFVTKYFFPVLPSANSQVVSLSRNITSIGISLGFELTKRSFDLHYFTYHQAYLTYSDQCHRLTVRFMKESYTNNSFFNTCYPINSKIFPLRLRNSHQTSNKSKNLKTKISRPSGIRRKAITKRGRTSTISSGTKKIKAFIFLAIEIANLANQMLAQSFPISEGRKKVTTYRFASSPRNPHCH